MKKNIFLTVLLLLIALVASAQDCKVKTIVVYQQDNKVDTLVWQTLTGTTFYGKENPQDDDYVQCYLKFESWSEKLWFGSILTKVARYSPYDAITTLLSSNPIDDTVIETLKEQGTLLRGSSSSLFFVDTQRWIPGYGIRLINNNPVYDISNCFSGNNGLKLDIGKTYYGRSICYLDGKYYLSKQQEMRTPKTISSMLEYVYPDCSKVRDNYYININTDSIIAAHPALFGEKTAYAKIAITDELANIMKALPDETLKGQVWKEEVCDDGTLYFIKATDAQIQQAIASIEQQVAEPSSIVADSTSVYFYDSETSGLMGTKNCNLKMWQCDEKWGVPNNQYLVTEPQYTAAKPTLALSMNRMMSPGKAYDITLIYAPATDAELNDSCNTYFNVYIADGKGERKYQDGYSTNDYIIFPAKKEFYEVGPKELTRITMAYQPKRFAYRHVLQLNHEKSFFTEKNRASYCQMFRVVGIEIKEHQDAESVRKNTEKK